MTEPFGGHGDLGPPPPLFQIGDARPPARRFPYERWLIVVAVVLVAFVLLSVARHIYAEVLWFDSIGYASVYKKTVVTQVWLFAAGFGIFLAFFWANLWLARRLLPLGPWVTGAWQVEIEPALLRRIVHLVAIVGGVLLAVGFGLAASAKWELVLQFLNAKSFGEVDPEFGRDVSFYIFRLPAWSFFRGWALGVSAVTLTAVVAVYAGAMGLRGFATKPSRAMALHVTGLVLLILALIGWGYWLDLLGLPNSSAGIVHGATYTDLHARQPMFIALMVITGVVMVLAVVTVYTGRLRATLIAVAGWVVVAVIGGAAVPAMVQRLQVEPNEYSREEPYIARNIEATRHAFGLDAVDVRQFPAEPAASEAEVQRNEPTIANIRLWDNRPLLDTYNQVQAIRPLYVFTDVDIDRYVVGGEYRQVMLSARELTQDRLPDNAQGWVNRRLQFTHGYGLAMSPVNEVGTEGLPTFFVQDIPPRGEIEVQRPEVYFGEVTDEYIITNSRQQEFSYPSGDTNVYSTYEGTGGIPIGGFFKRAVFAWELADWNILISHEITSDSRLLYRRDVVDRAKAIAPFLTYDADPYLVVADGRLSWILDAYTTADDFPYSEPTGDGFNYIRNSVKVVVDAYNGTTTFYMTDPNDALLRTYMAIYPTLFTPLDQMPASLRVHLRYPEGLLLAQAEVYNTYHMTDPQVFYNKEDLWKIPNELFGSEQVMAEPYYTIMRLPGEATEEFVLILPFAPANRDNTVAWMAARSDGANYGRLLAFQFPKDRLIYGPAQIEARIDQDPLISQQLTLWNQSGSRVLRGNLLMIPLETSVIYVEPIFLQAEQSQLPELRRVVVANGNDIAMEPTLSRAFDVLFGHAPRTLPGQESAEPAGTPTVTPTGTGTPEPSTTPTPGPDGLPDSVDALAVLADETYQNAQTFLRAGDLEGYGREIEKLGAILEKLRRLAE